MEKELKIKDKKISLKFKLGWKEATKFEKIVSVIFYISIVILIVYLIKK